MATWQGELHGTLAQFFPAEVEAWENELVADLDALDPLDPEELDDLQRYLVRLLWGAKVTERSDLADVARKRLAMLRAAGSEVSAASLSLLDRYELHLSGALDWSGVRSLILEGERRRLSPDAAAALQDIVNDPVRLATLLAKAALDDRARLKLTADPTAAAFAMPSPNSPSIQVRSSNSIAG